MAATTNIPARRPISLLFYLRCALSRAADDRCDRWVALTCSSADGMGWGMGDGALGA